MVVHWEGRANLLRFQARMTRLLAHEGNGRYPIDLAFG